MYLNCSESDPLGVFRDDKEIIMAGIEKDQPCIEISLENLKRMMKSFCVLLKWIDLSYMMYQKYKT